MKSIFIHSLFEFIAFRTEEHKYNMVKFEVGETEVKCSNCGAILTRKIIE